MVNTALKSNAISNLNTLMKNEPNISTGLAAIKTLIKALESSKATTAIELDEELNTVVSAMESTDYSSTSIRSASDLFRKFISLAPAELIDQPDFVNILNFYNNRGRMFIERVARSRDLICKYSRPFFTNSMRLLTHSYSKVVLSVIRKAFESGVDLEVFVTESQPNASGKKMHEELVSLGINSTLILDSAIGYLMERMDAVIVGAEGVMESGGIINKIGTLSMSICAKMMNKPVYVMAESIKFVKEYPLNQTDIPEEFKYRTSVREGRKDLSSEHPEVDYTPPAYITLLFTDLGILTPAAVGEELIKLYT
ncbi:hypothetical protein PFISCL1PPCAC_9968 [Pristionchus fissidentatus]|uniref:Translation initiation factor eIF2B subunit alpha n=1 Tax=Pristionchus fissidentatus TaxID=1538716 RepID=A0AAV5VH18_9BILA|nr:hypothetical protein PFISCL1PPCAC_9968 [Pristionchus fissidentatus]